MSNLIFADLNRIRRNVWFLFSMIVMFVFGIYEALQGYGENIRFDFANTPDKSFCGYIIPVCILCAMLCCVICGEEFEYGTIRNKISVGHSREEIYTSQLLTCCIAGISMCLAYLIPQLSIGVVLLGDFTRSAEELWAYLFSGILLIAACISVYCLIITAVGRQTAGTALTMLILLLIVYFGIIVKNDLELPQQTYRFIPETGEMTKTMMDNPMYPTGAYRRFLEIIYDFLPSSQAYQIFYMTAQKLPRLMISSVIIIVLSVFIGLRVLRKKDIR